MTANNMRDSIILTREQIEKLTELAHLHPEVDSFKLSWSHEQSGIGLGLLVKYQTFDPEDTIIDITDVRNW
jgi:hypothetical protein